jgi:hypothetical protein
VCVALAEMLCSVAGTTTLDRECNCICILFCVSISLTYVNTCLVSISLTYVNTCLVPISLDSSNETRYHSIYFLDIVRVLNKFIVQKHDNANVKEMFCKRYRHKTYVYICKRYRHKTCVYICKRYRHKTCVYICKRVLMVHIYLHHSVWKWVQRY